MISLPAPFVAALLLAILVISRRTELHSSASGRLFAAMLWLNVFSLMLVGLRWSLDLTRLLPLLAAATSTATTALLYLGFASLGDRDPPRRRHVPAVLAMLLVALLLPRWTDWALVSVKLFYAGALTALARGSDETLQRVRIGRLISVRWALWGAAALTLGGAALDLGIAADFARHDGRHAPLLVGLVSLALVLLLGWTAVLAGDARALPANDDPAHEAARSAVAAGAEGSGGERTAESRGNRETDDPRSVMARLDALLLDGRRFADPELNLQRLARKAGVPARIVSRTVNAQTGLNVSQWVNRARIDEACRLLADEGVSVTRAMHEAGFLTKSSFHREFRRIHGCSPTEWRERRAHRLVVERRTG